VDHLQLFVVKQEDVYPFAKRHLDTTDFDWFIRRPIMTSGTLIGSRAVFAMKDFQESRVEKDYVHAAMTLQPRVSQRYRKSPANAQALTKKVKEIALLVVHGLCRLQGVLHGFVLMLCLQKPLKAMTCLEDLELR
jgi:hypothetical protein